MKTYTLKPVDDNREDRKTTSRVKLIAEDETVWMALDVHKKNFSVTVLGKHDDAPLFQGKLPRGQEHIAGLMRRLPGCKVWACYEAGPTGYKMLRWLRDHGADAIMVPPSLVPTRQGSRVKTDRRDSYRLARCLRGGMLDAVHDLSDEQYEHRELVRTYRQIVEHRSDLCRQIKSKLLFHGVDTPDELKGSSWSKAYLEWLDEGPSQRSCLDIVFAEMARTYRQLTARIKRLKKAIEELADEEYADQVELLKTAPGVGVLTAMTFLVELGDLERFDNCEEFSSYLGVVPWEHSSGERTHKGGLTRTGNKRVRTALVEASWQTIGKSEHLREVYDRIKYRHGDNGAQVAIVAVARRLGLALRAMLRDGVGWCG